MKKFISGFLAGALLCSGIAFGVSYVAEPASFKVLVNGNEFRSDPPALVVDGRTYLPLRAIGDALSVPVTWNNELGQAEVGNCAPLAATGEYSRNNPAPLNTVQTITVESFLGNYSIAARVMETVRGEKAAAMVRDANMFNDAAPAGKEYIVAKIAFSVLATDNDKSVDVSTYNFDCFSSNNESYESPYSVAPAPALDATLYPGGNTEGYAVFLVNASDASPKISYGTAYDGSGGIWFSLQ